MVIRLSLEKDRKIFFLLMVICCVEVILCRSVDTLGPWQHWTRCSVSCGEGEQNRRRDCLHPPHQIERGMQTMHSDIGCRGNKSVVVRRPCNMEPCSLFETEFDPSSLSSSSSYRLTDPAEIIHRYRNEENPAAIIQGYGSMSTEDDGFSVVNKEIVCSNSTRDNHVRLRRAIRLSVGEMIYSKWTPWTRCSCTSSTHTRYRFCIVGKRQCIRTKGRFPTKETSSCQCRDTQGSNRNRLFRTYPSERTDPYTSWSNWGGCPCERDAFRTRTRLCRPGHEIACLESKEQTGIGLVKLKRCRARPECQGSGPMSDLLAQGERLSGYSPPPNPNHGSQVISRPASNPSLRFTQQERPLIPSEPEYEMPNRASAQLDEQPPESLPESPVALPVEPISWSSWSEWEICGKTCGTENTFRWRECQDDHGQLVPGCEGEYIETGQCSNAPCPMEILPTTSRPETLNEDPIIEPPTQRTRASRPNIVQTANRVMDIGRRLFG